MQVAVNESPTEGADTASGSRAAATTILSDVLPRLLHVLLAVAVLALAAAGLLTRSPLRTMLESAHVHAGVVLGFLAAVAAVVVAGRARAAWQGDLLVAAVLGAMYAAIPTREGLGDGSWKMLSTDGTKDLWTSSYLSHLFLRGLYGIFEDIRFYAPAMGFLTALLVLRCLRAVFPQARLPTYALTRLVYVAVGLHLIFFADFVETTMPSVVVALVGIPALLRYAAAPSTSGRHEERNPVGDIAVATGCLVLAACFHGQFIVVFPVVAFITATRLAFGVPVRLVAREAATAVATAVGVVAAVYVATVPVLGYDPVTGDATGGSDAKRWAVDFFGAAHAQVAGSAVASVAIGALVGAVALFAVVRQRRFGGVPSATFALLGLAYVGFVSSWGYDLGFPRDADLMFSIGAIAVPAFALWTEEAAASLNRFAVAALVLAATAAQVVVTSTLLRV